MAPPPRRNGGWVASTDRWQVFPARQARTGTRRAAACSAARGHGQPQQPLHQGCVGCETQGRPGGRDGQVVQYQRSGNGHRRQRLVGAAAALERREVQRVLHRVVRSTGRQARAALSALVRTRMRGAVREPVNGEADTGGARSAAATSRGDARCRRSRPGRVRRAPRRARRAAPARGGHGGHRHNAVEPRHERVVPAAAVSAASRRANGVRSDRRARRREGYPPEGPRPRSGLGRVARSRSDAPRLIVAFTALPSIIGTVVDIGVCTIARIAVIVRTVMVADTLTTATISR